MELSDADIKEAADLAKQLCEERTPDQALVIAAAVIATAAFASDDDVEPMLVSVADLVRALIQGFPDGIQN